MEVVVASAAAVLLAAAGVQLGDGLGEAFTAFVFLLLRRLPLVAFVFSCPLETWAGDEAEGAGVGEAGALCELEEVS